MKLTALLSSFVTKNAPRRSRMSNDRTKDGSVNKLAIHSVTLRRVIQKHKHTKPNVNGQRRRDKRAFLSDIINALFVGKAIKSQSIHAIITAVLFMSHLLLNECKCRYGAAKNGRSSPPSSIELPIQCFLSRSFYGAQQRAYSAAGGKNG